MPPLAVISPGRQRTLDRLVLALDALLSAPPDAATARHDSGVVLDRLLAGLLTGAGGQPS